MQVITTEIEIAASPEQVWDVLSDVESWGDWSPIIKEVSGRPEEGSKLQVTMSGKDESKSGPKYAPTILKFSRPKKIHWRAHMMASFLFTNDKILELEEVDNGTKLIHKETFKGLMAKMMCKQMEVGVPPMLATMNMALKEKVESNK